MGRRIKKRKAEQFLKRKYFYFIESFLIFIIIISFMGGYFFFQKKRNNDKKYLIVEKKYNKKKKILINKIKELDDINSKIIKYNELDKSISDVQDEYFKDIKKLEDDILAGKSDKKIAYLTFDDGPYYNTYKVLDILDEYHVKATFFTISMNGEYCFDNKSSNCYDLYKEYVKRGHTIANHTYTHAIKNGLYSSVDSFMDAVIKQEEHIKNQTGGYITSILRFPGGSAQAKDLKGSITEKLKERGYGWVDWTAQDGDGKGIASWNQGWDIFTNSINDKIEVVLFHDYNHITTDILPTAITYLQENGYQIYPLFYDSNVIQK